jgi:GNAT superfamily N-acetyltransferase
MSTSWSIRRVICDDAAIVAAHGAFRDSDKARRPGYEAWVRARIESGTYLGHLALAGGRVVGGAGAVLLDWGPTRANPGGTMARIANVFTDEAWRRRGIARALVETVLAQCEVLGIQEFNLGATSDARALYESIGFESYPAEMRRRLAPA